MNGTARRLSGSDYNYAERLVMSGVPISHAARMTGVDAARLAGLPRPGRTSFDPSPTAPPRRYRSGKKAPDLTPALCRPDTLDVIRAVADRYDLSVCDLLGPATRRRIAYARHEAMAAVRDMGRLSFPQIGRIFGGRDHTSVLTGIRHHHARIAWANVLIWAGNVEQPNLFAAMERFSRNCREAADRLRATA